MAEDRPQATRTPSRPPIGGCGGVRVSLSADQCDLLYRHLDLVIERNKTLNLTRITDPDEAVYLHIVDSLLLAGACAGAPEGPIVDIGTGAGYPGIPLAIATGRNATLVDSVRKKADAVGAFVHELSIEEQIHVEAVRIEDLARRERSRYAVAVARAVAPASVLVEYAAPLLVKRGRLIVAKARPSDEEVSDADRVAKICGMSRVSRETFELPQGLGHREVITYERVGKPRVRLPRTTGAARHRPL